MINWRPKVVKDTFVTESGEVFEAHKLAIMGDSKEFVPDQTWVERHAPHDWVEVEGQSNSLEVILRPLTDAKNRAVSGERS